VKNEEGGNHDEKEKGQRRAAAVAELITAISRSSRWIRTGSR